MASASDTGGKRPADFACKPGDYVEVYLDHAKVGSGRRCYVVVEIGRKWITLFYDARLVRIRESLAAFRRGSPRHVDVRPNRLRRLIEERRRQFKRFNREAEERKTDRPCPFTVAHVRAALALLTPAQPAA